ncbi:MULTISPECIES: CPBP family intramembrane glutamic endopeptidase [unclassified Lactobacillus]|uniref:CPBP family intramembrane glutamic endopeptidase n=1 Tax=unclassified Lactobacillus TaxID=2620435 RepID=UPI000EFC612E|nr:MULTISPECIES: type II CAAX endopeptidase family protein [unclassified Lactobacillus]RMC24965.1 CPBP family intramembrane metalloprotease [Lactobacillus sp. ESL0247]RMC29120.1 CPBP family intramembrane metalloprotease [Lactobacillus sp. ESL0246]RMC32723.1 CPBP family intramembrane metalloprotease [Lactobacillus sp. ESL0245]
MKQLGQIILYLLKAAAYFFWFLVTFLLMQVPTLAERLNEHETRNNVNILHHVLILIIGCLVGFVAVYIFYKKINGTPILSVKLRVRNLLSSLGITTISFLIQLIIGKIGSIGNTDNDLIRLLHTRLGIIVFFTLVISGPILETLFFQGGLQGGIFKKMNPWLAVILTSLIFALAHGEVISWAALQLFVSGLGFSLIYLVTKDIKMSILSHSLINLIIWILRFF